MSIWAQPVTLEDLRQRNAHTLVELLEIDFIELGADFLVARMPISAKVLQPLGIMHGGASCVLAETVGSNAANLAVPQSQYYCVGLDINTNHIRAIKQGSVTAKATPYHLGKSTQVWGITIHNEQQQLISVNRLTMAVMRRKLAS